MDTRLQEGIIGFLLFVVGKENQTANFICKWGNSLMYKTVVRFAFFFSSSFFFFFFLAWHTCHCNTDTGSTSPSTDPIMSGAWQGSHWVPSFKSLVWLDPEKARRKRNSNPGSSAPEADSLTTRPARRWPAEETNHYATCWLMNKAWVESVSLDKHMIISPNVSIHRLQLVQTVVR